MFESLTEKQMQILESAGDGALTFRELCLPTPMGLVSKGMRLLMLGGQTISKKEINELCELGYFSVKRETKEEHGFVIFFFRYERKPWRSILGGQLDRIREEIMRKGDAPLSMLLLGLIFSQNLAKDAKTSLFLSRKLWECLKSEKENGQ